MEIRRQAVRDIATLILAIDSVMGDDMDSWHALEHARLLARSCDLDPLWAGGKHCGDCTKEPHTCVRCMVEEAQDRAREILEKEGFEVVEAT